jgi:4'-phosphopantetheinyl transferase
MAVGTEVGVDLERVRDVSEMADLALRWFTVAEQLDLIELAPTERCARFYEIWTAKEAYIKANCGAFVKSFAAVESLARDRLRETEPNSSLVWHCRHLSFSASDMCAVVHAGSERALFGDREFLAEQPGEILSRILADDAQDVRGLIGL